MSLISLKIELEDFSTETFTFPSVNLPKTLTAACIYFLLSFKVKSKLAESGSEEYPETKIDLGKDL